MKNLIIFLKLLALFIFTNSCGSDTQSSNSSELSGSKPYSAKADTSKLSMSERDIAVLSDAKHLNVAETNSHLVTAAAVKKRLLKSFENYRAEGDVLKHVRSFSETSDNIKVKYLVHVQNASLTWTEPYTPTLTEYENFALPVGLEKDGQSYVGVGEEIRISVKLRPKKYQLLNNINSLSDNPELIDSEDLEKYNNFVKNCKELKGKKMLAPYSIRTLGSYLSPDKSKVIHRLVPLEFGYTLKLDAIYFREKLEDEAMMFSNYLNFQKNKKTESPHRTILNPQVSFDIGTTQLLEAHWNSKVTYNYISKGRRPHPGTAEIYCLSDIKNVQYINHNVSNIDQFEAIDYMTAKMIDGFIFDTFPASKK